MNEGIRLVDEFDNDIAMSDVDETLGRVIPSSIVIHHEAVEHQEEQGHWETVAEYENGGKDVAWVVDVEERKAKEAYDEYIAVMRYVCYTAKELKERTITELKQKLNDTDYIAAKSADMLLNASSISELFSLQGELRKKYSGVLNDRASWRNQINALEAEIANEE